MNEDNKLKLKKNGDLSITEDGSTSIVAKYDQVSGTLEFTTKENSLRYMQQATMTVGTTGDGKEISSRAIKRICVKGDDAPKADLPKRPKLGPKGDAAKEIVEYYLKHDLPQAIVRYGIYQDSKGNLIKREVRRIIENTIDQRNTHTDEDLEWVKTPGSHKSREKAPISRERELVETTGIIARRATDLTFTPNECIGGFDPEDDLDAAPVAGEEGAE